MKKFIYILVLFVSTVLVYGQNVYNSNSIYVKYRNIKAANTQSSSSHYKIEPAFRLGINANRHFSKKADSLLSELSNVWKLTYNKAIDPVKMSQLLNNMPEVEYAEPIPKSNIFAGETNDPDLNQLYHLYLTEAFEAWNMMNGDTVLIGIVDTGIDFEHEDLVNQIWYNPGENGLDEFGIDKSTNSIDDDGNGYIDDWRGWDFGSESGYDNDPSYGGDHGVHVSGIAAAQVNNKKGVAGVSPRAKILSVKIGPDFGLDNSVYNEYEGLLYAAIMGADVINCSWGGTGYSQTNAAIVETAIELGALIVAAAGNNNRNQAFYPASYDGVLSVASSAEDDLRSGFSNFNTRVDISAPGTFIYSTVPDNKYDFKSGTSMASPVAAGAAAVLRSQFPLLSPQQIKSLLIVNSDNIDNLNPKYEGLIGSGRLNLFKAIKRENSIAVNLKDDIIKSEDKSGVIKSGSKIKLDLVFENVLDNIDNLDIIIGNDKFIELEIDNTVFSFQDLAMGEVFSIEDEINLEIPKETPENYNFNLKISAFSKGNRIQDFYVNFIANPSYLNIENEKIIMTVTSDGNHGFNDFSENIQGDGFRYESPKNLMFEGGFMMTQKGKPYVADGVRNRSGIRDNDLFSLKKIEIDKKDAFTFISASFTDKVEGGFGNYDSLALGIEVKHEAYLFDSEGMDNSILLRYILRNNNTFNMDSIYAGLFYDWDISEGGSNDIVSFDTTGFTGFAEEVDGDNTPIVGVHLHSKLPFNCYAIDNAAFKEEMGIYDGYTEEEKQMTLSSGIARVSSRPNKDGSMVISAGPLFIPSQEKIEILFSINAAYSKEEIGARIELLDEKLKSIDLQSKVDDDKQIKIVKLFPNPVTNSKQVEAFIQSDTFADVTLKIFDYRGRVIIDLGAKRLIEGYNHIIFSTESLSQGSYYLGVVKEDKIFPYSFVIVNE